MPPTVAQVQRFLRCTDRGAGEVMGVILPDNRAASVWSVAVNVTGGLTEIASVMGSAVSNFGIVHSGKAAVLLAPATARQLAADG